MSFAYEISPSGAHVRIVGADNITTADCVRLVRSVVSNPRCRPDSTALVDLRAAIYEPRAMEEVISIATTLEMFPSMLGNNIAIVARRATLFYAEIFSAHVRAATRVPIKVFVELDAAVRFCMGNK